MLAFQGEPGRNASQTFDSSALQRYLSASRGTYHRLDLFLDPNPPVNAKLPYARRIPDRDM